MLFLFLHIKILKKTHLFNRKISKKRKNKNIKYHSIINANKITPLFEFRILKKIIFKQLININISYLRKQCYQLITFSPKFNAFNTHDIVNTVDALAGNKFRQMEWGSVRLDLSSLNDRRVIASRILIRASKISFDRHFFSIRGRNIDPASSSD